MRITLRWVIANTLLFLVVVALIVFALQLQGCSDCAQPMPFMNADRADDRLPEPCMEPAPSMAPCLDALVARYYLPPPIGEDPSTAERRGERLVASFANPFSLRLEARLGQKTLGFDGADALASKWQAELNRSYNHPRSKPIVRRTLSISRGGMITQPMRSPMHFRPTDLVYALWHGEASSKRQIMSCGGGAEVGIADSAEATAGLSDRDRDLAKACLYYALGAPIPSWFRDDAELHRAVLVATAFRSCVQALLPGDTYRVQKVTEDPEALRAVARCMEEDLAR
ncbi:hypothetical protein [Dongia sp.]|uniref:hypothetical protein n=1 Tax=Dongia sp. TaxID=1977262 RepID=UPI00375231C8